ncbi:MAG: histidine phosphatase family protein [Lachnospiraceae bacterium]|nr:histidine phosphatase family protein [Lachnospiraceae bacterium]
MRLILIRHAEPDYAHNTITEKGKREAKALAERVKHWNVTDFYTSPLGRAIDTAEPTLKALGRTAETLEWAKEFDYRCIDPATGRDHLCWDYVPSDWTGREGCFTLDDWVHTAPMSENPEIEKQSRIVCEELDKLLLKYGYKRDGLIYRTVGRKQENRIHTAAPNNMEYGFLDNEPENGPTVVIFCHLGVSCLMMSHLLNIPFMTLPHGLFIPPTGINILTTEERWEDEASFRAQAIGDCAHLLMAGEKLSSAGSFSPAFQM